MLFLSKIENFVFLPFCHEARNFDFFFTSTVIIIKVRLGV